MIYKQLLVLQFTWALELFAKELMALITLDEASSPLVEMGLGKLANTVSPCSIIGNFSQLETNNFFCSGKSNF